MGRYSYGPGFGMMGGYGFGGIFGLAGILFGIVVMVSALMLYNKPIEHSKWGLLILIFSVLSIFGSAMAGFGVGLILGVLGGIFALTWKPPHTENVTSNLHCVMVIATDVDRMSCRCSRISFKCT